MRTDISFPSQGLTCRGWLYLPDDHDNGQALPTIIMAHGFSDVKEHALPEFAQKFNAAGFAAVVFDYRFYGDSDGEPRCQSFPLEMADDFRNAITWACEQANIDGARIGLWGTSFAGGIVTYAATFDKRVKAVVAQVPTISNGLTRRAADTEAWERPEEFLLAVRLARFRSGEVNYLKVVAPEGEPCFLAGKEAYDFFMETKTAAPNWRNGVTVESMEKIRQFDPLSQIGLMSHAALLVIAAEHDTFKTVESLEYAVDQAGGPAKLTKHPVGHFDVYKDPWLTIVVDEAIDWYNEYLV